MFEILDMIEARGRGEMEVGAEKCRAEFGDGFLDELRSRQRRWSYKEIPVANGT